MSNNEQPDDVQKKVRLVPAQTSFDFLEGEYSKARKSRLTTLGVLAVSALAVMLIVAQGLSMRLQKNEIDSDISAARDELTLAQNQLSATAEIAGLTSTDAGRFITQRAVVAAQITQLELDVTRTLAPLLVTPPAGITISDVTYEITQDIPADVFPTLIICPSGDTVMAPPVSETPIPVATVTVSAIIAEGADYRPWTDALDDISDLLDVAVTETSADGEVRVLAVAKMNPFARSDRNVEFGVAADTAQENDPCGNGGAPAPSPDSVVTAESGEPTTGDSVPADTEPTTTEEGGS